MFNLHNLSDFVQQPGNQQTLAFLAAGGAVAVSLITGIIGPMVALCVARRQIRATVALSNRQKRIDSLQDTIAELMAIDFVVEETGVLSNAEISTKVYNLRNKILLLTNPTESDHVELNRLIHELVVQPHVLRQDETNPNAHKLVPPRTLKNIHDLQDEIVAVARRVLKSEWKRVRKGN